MRQDDALEVAKLAAMIGGELKKVDQFTIERSNNPANKININNFIAKVKNPSVEIRPASYLTQSNDFVALPESFVQSQVPDIVPSYNPQTLPSASEPVHTFEQIADIPVKLESEQVKSKTTSSPKLVLHEDNAKPLLTRSDIDSIRNSLKSIDKTLAGMLKFLQENSKPKANE
jgi:hypothetical protein